MVIKEKAIKNYKQNKLFLTFILPITLIIFTLFSLLLLYPAIAADGIKKGLSVCLETIIPSLFPFILLTNLAYDAGIFDIFSKKADRITGFLFSLNGAALPIIIMSFIGGYPIGAAMIEKSFERGELSSSQAKRMLMFCVNPGPAFTVSAIGASLLNSAKSGVIIYASVSFSSLLVGVLSRFLINDEEPFNSYKKNEAAYESISAVTSAINLSIKAMANICVWVIVFSCIGELVENLTDNETLLMYFRMFSEVTGGVVTAGKNFSLPVISAVVSFAGFCVHLQVAPCIIKLHMKYKFFLAIRILCAALSSAVTYTLLKLFPVYITTVSLGVKPQSASLKVPFPVCAWLLIMCGLFIVGDNYIVRKKQFNNIK